MSGAPRGTRGPGGSGGLGVALAALALALTACSAGTGASGAGTSGVGMSGAGASGTPAAEQLVPPEQALQRMDALLDESLAQVRPALRSWDDNPDAVEQFSKGLDEHSLGYADANRRRHIMTRIAPAKYGTLLDMVESGWKAKGYTVTRTASTPPGSVASAPDGAGVGITVHSSGLIEITAHVSPVPVIHGAFGTPTPVPTLPNGNPDDIPAYDDPFWSN
ncbi:hypothetical protein ABTZ03_10280 [Kitasatospora sp. NPDC096077]|uniref:hypothetical protein n=1 Tax=Kitasatospora sp. NPDC096077 TaxID=3155544 RepID=UPI00332EDE00